MDVTPEEFVSRLVTEEAHMEPCDEGGISDLKQKYPPWFDEKLYRAGQKFFMYNLFGQMGALLAGLISLISVPTTLDIMVHTKNSASPCTAYVRYITTFLHGLAWTEHDLKPGSLCWKSLKYVRAKHLRVDKSARTCGKGTISQRDLALTQFGMMGYIFLRPDLYGIESCEKDSWEGFNHLWRTICYMIGLKDKYNLCIGTAEDTRQICLILKEKVFSHLLENPPEPFEHIAHSILDGMWCALPLIEPKQLMYMTRYVAGVPGYVLTEGDLIASRRRIRKGEFKNSTKPMLESWPTADSRPELNIDDFYLLSTVPEYKKLFYLDRLKMHAALFLTKLYGTAIGRYLLNKFVRFIFLLAEHFPILAIPRFGYKRSLVDMFSVQISDDGHPRSNAEMKEFYAMPPWYVKWYPFL